MQIVSYPRLHIGETNYQPNILEKIKNFIAEFNDDTKLIEFKLAVLGVLFIIVGIMEGRGF